MKTEINGETGIMGIIGGNINKTLSPFLHNTLLKHYSLNDCYLPFQISTDQLPAAIEGLKALNIKGVNITVPFKEKSMEFLDKVENSALRIGAINTIVHKDKLLFGYNTDFIGFKRSLMEEKEIEIKGKSAIVLGAGGAARAIIYALCQEAIKEISIFNRTLDKARKIEKEYHAFFPDCPIRIFPIGDRCLQDKINRVDFLINTTSLGSYPDINLNPLPENILLNQHLIAYDLIYFPAKTSFLRQAEKAGAKTINGGQMLVYQAVESFYLWTGIRPEMEIVRQLIHKFHSKNAVISNQ
ncbi:MAG: shikimate dehydrogenase [Candidatus Caldatribacteriota bacterium]|nr:shikimate dehydrogenase [Candidatus Caldatribacteriota bacterium]